MDNFVMWIGRIVCGLGACIIVSVMIYFLVDKLYQLWTGIIGWAKIWNIVAAHKKREAKP